MNKCFLCFRVNMQNKSNDLKVSAQSHIKENIENSLLSFSPTLNSQTEGFNMQHEVYTFYMRLMLSPLFGCRKVEERKRNLFVGNKSVWLEPGG